MHTGCAATWIGFLFKQVRASGIATMERTDVTEVTREENRWCVFGYHGEEPVRIWAEFVLDASGGTGRDAEGAGHPQQRRKPADQDANVVRPLHRMSGTGTRLPASRWPVEQHPYRCDEAAVHHIIDGGWMWQLQFRNGVTSAGLVLDHGPPPLPS
jgi:tetracycline 7-halogenase / FADH2 O2-dependent halogenase